MPPVGHFKQWRTSIIWGNVEAPVTGGSATTPDWDKVSSFSALTSQALPVEGVSFFSINPQLRRVNRQTGKRYRTSADTWNDLKGSIPGVTLSMPATKEVLDLFLAMGLQHCVEGASTPYIKTFSYPSATAAAFTAGRYPEFAADEGYFCGIVNSWAGSAAYTSYEEVLLGCVPTKVTLSCSSDKHDGELWLDVDLIGRYFSSGVTYTGTITEASQEDTGLFHINDIVTNDILGGTDCPIYGFEFEINTGLMFVPMGMGSSTTGGGAVDAVMAGPNVSGFVDFLGSTTGGLTAYAAARGAYLQSQFGNATNQIGWGNATPSATGDLLITWFGQGTNLEPVGSDETRWKWSFDCAEYSSNDAFGVVLANALDRGWTQTS